MQNLRDFFSRQISQLPVFLPIPFGLGIIIYFSLSNEPSWSLGIVPLIISLFGAVSLYKSRFDSPALYAQWVILISLTLASSGFLAAKFQTWSVQAPVIEETQKFAQITGRIVSIENLPGKGARIRLSQLQIEGFETQQTPEYIRIRFWDAEGLEIGQKITFLGHLTPPSAAVSPGGFEFQRYAYFRQTGGFGFSYEKPEILDKHPASPIAKARKELQTKISDILTDDSGAVATALLTGFRSAISEDDREDLRHAGLAHLLAISGLHVGLVAGFLFFSSRLLMATSSYMALLWPIKKIAALIAMTGTIFYTIFVGAPVPTQRALIMTGIALLAVMLDRSPFSMRIVALAAFCILLFQPSSLLGVSFQLSFAAVIALIAFYERFRVHISGFQSYKTAFHRFVTYLVGIALTSIIATLGTAPLTLYHFQHLALYSVIGNILALPVMMFWVMPMAVFVFLLWPLGLEKWPVLIMGEGVRWVLAIADYVADLPGAVLRVVSWPPWILAAMLVGGLWLCLIQGRARALGSIPVIFALIAGFMVYPADIKISESGKLFAIRDPKSGTMHFSSRRSESFAREVWARENGQNPERKPLVEQSPGILCDESGCRGKIKNYKISFAYEPYIHKGECAWADILISSRPVRYKNCESDYVIDRFDMWRKGAHAIYLEPGEPEIRTTLDYRADRPWLIKLPGRDAR